MQLWQNGIISLLAAIGLASILWMLVCAVMFSPAQRQRAVALICARGDGSDLEDQARTLLLLRSHQRTVDEILLVDCGLTEEGKALCRRLAGQNSRISLCGRDEIEQHIT